MKNKRKLNIKIVIVSIVVIIFITCMLYNVISLFINPTSTFMIENGKISSSSEKIGYIIREETVLQGNNYKNGISQIKTEGQKVAKGENIFRYYTNNEESLNKKIAELDLQIQDALEQNENIYSSDIAALDKQIETNLQKIANTNNRIELLEYKKQINTALTKKAKLTGDLSPAGSYIKKLILQRSKYEEQLNSGAEYIQASTSGAVSYKIDGLEEKLNPDNFENITEKYLEQLKIKTGEMIATSSSSGKIVNNYYCYIATFLEPEESQNVEEGKNIIIALSTGNELKAKVVYIKEQEKGNNLVILKINNYVEDLISYRKISFEIIWWSANGLKVPNSAIIEKDNKQYIIRKRVGYTDEIIIKVLKTSEDYSIIENYTSLELKELGFSTEEIKTAKNISLYDEIVLNPTK